VGGEKSPWIQGVKASNSNGDPMEAIADLFDLQ
jgi:hypothetical protein